MFRRRRAYEVAEQKAVEGLFSAWVTLHVDEARRCGGRAPTSLVHVMTTDRDTARRYAVALHSLGEGLGLTVALLEPDQDHRLRERVFRSDLVAGAVGDFTADAEATARLADRLYAFVQGAPGTAADSLLSGYRSVRVLDDPAAGST